MAMELKGFFVIRDAAKLLGISRATIHRWLNSGKIQPVLIAGRRLIPESEIDRLKKEEQEQKSL